LLPHYGNAFLNKQPLNIGIFTGTRAEYGLLFPIIKAMRESNAFEPVLYVAGTHLDARYGQTVNEIERDGFPIVWRCPLSGPERNMAGECGLLTQRLGEFFSSPPNRPDCVLLLGDRYEALGAAIAAFLSNIPLAHVHGGDVVRGGMLDDSIRHAITKLAHLHFPATRASADRILALGEEPWRVTVAGSPAVDNIRQSPVMPKAFFAEEYNLDPDKPWILFTQHSITTESNLAGEQARQTLLALASLEDSVQVIATYPNQDEGSQAIVRQLEDDFALRPQFRVIPSLGRLNYLNLLRYVSVVVGNSSSGLLETAYFGLPCLNIGERQKDRERGGNVMDIPQEEMAIQQALRRVLSDKASLRQFQNAPHPFGEGHCAEKILQVLMNTRFDQNLLRKQLTY
jgi:GDP/UDP-N,N'-diacetylbacillosamine 2-epimerase (hydrolysing)